jgi:hypothetical protein
MTSNPTSSAVAALLWAAAAGCWFAQGITSVGVMATLASFLCLLAAARNHGQ